jgi:NitT/TauT family transport system substrate-binding protein
LFNQFTEGFGIKLIASISQAAEGWNDTTWSVVRKDVWDAGSVRTLADVKGRKVEGGPDGSPVRMLILNLLKKAGLTRKDVEFSERFRSGPDIVALRQKEAIDIAAAPEPVVTQLEATGVAQRWLGYRDLSGGLQDSLLASSGKFLADNRDALRRFLRAYLKAVKEVDAAGSRWTPEMTSLLVKWTGLPENVLRQIPGPAYVGQYGVINLDSIRQQQDFWHAEGLVKTLIDPALVVDASIIEQARADLGLK